jgi:8-oxo-dGTP pyrophosphatase MutT (NUDIX family)
MVYEQYDHRNEYRRVPISYGGFAVVRQQNGNGETGVIIKQRNGRGGSPFLFDLPGGRKELFDDSLAITAARELAEEIGISSDPSKSVAIGGPLWLPIYRDGTLERVDCAQAFLVEAGNEVPVTTEEAINIATVTEESALGFSIVGLRRSADPSQQLFGRTPIMLWDGLSLCKAPFFRVGNPTLTERERFEARIGMSISEDLVLPVDEGRYLARLNGGAIELYHRLNPFEPNGRFAGKLEDLA